MLAICYTHEIVYTSASYSSLLLHTILLACKKVCAQHRVTSLKHWWYNIFYKWKWGMQNQGNNLSFHYLRAFVTILWLLNISRDADSTWTAVLLQMVYSPVEKTWTNFIDYFLHPIMVDTVLHKELSMITLQSLWSIQIHA